MNRPWWMSGVPFSCQPNCGKCCDEPGGIVYLRPEDAQTLANHHDMEVKDWLERDCRQTMDGGNREKNIMNETEAKFKRVLSLQFSPNFLNFVFPVSWTRL